MRAVCVHGPRTPLLRGSKALPLPSLVISVRLLEQFFALLPIMVCSYFSLLRFKKVLPVGVKFVLDVLKQGRNCI